ncbi:hypothetical protein DRW48_08145 [Paracoccus suum]|uniref:TfoX N-terminal domain-containing protein n=1 Tax=Paracoccus suum TaxID=2259340 RepID=A0A344PJW0_9RHOB|nr:TfoX/Sxy family protein [Paracoccus suum]AXC49665.1 hypothetical protein DRW48_08145 [Paracoccus suum]
MARDPEVEDLLRDALLAHLPRGTQLQEKPMFGAICFILHGNMIGGASDRGVMLRIGKEAVAEAMTVPGVGLIEMSGRRMGGYIRADETAWADPESLARLTGLAARFTAALPPK